MDRTRIALLAAVLTATTGCGTNTQVEQLYIGGWIFLALIFLALVVLLVLIVRYIAGGRKEAPPTEPVDTLPPTEDTGDPNDWL